MTLLADQLVDRPDDQTAISSLHAVSECTERWAAVFNAGDPQAIAALYQDDGVLWGTVASELWIGREAIRQYFERACVPGALPRVQLEQQHLRVMGEIAVNSGAYLFHVIENGVERALPARFSMVWRKTTHGWLIADHHSSARPQPSAS